MKILKIFKCKRSRRYLDVLYNCNTIDHVEYSKFKNKGDFVIRIRKVFIQNVNISIAVNANRRERGRLCKGLSTYLLCSHPIMSFFTNFSILVSKFSSLNFQIISFLYVLILITYCIILSRIISCVTNSSFPSPVGSTRLDLFIIYILSSSTLF